ncbi:MAG TPA: TonB family protein [Terracidiphilus sp.]|jgi:TonB family protein|nr:TonB family protein [Terracidiphilus sp.]
MNVEAMCTGWVGRVIDGRFTLRELLDASETRAVFITDLPGSVPRKAILKIIEADGDDVDRRLGAWALAAALSHPHLVRVYHSGRCTLDQVRCVYVVTEYADEVLSEIIPVRPLTPEETREMLVPVLDALEWLHGSGFVHGHVRPSNILVVGEDLKISSDGLAAAGSMRPVSAPSSIYDAPESRSAPLAPAADVWSLGVTVVEALTQHAPAWDRTTSAEPFISGNVSQPFADIVHACLRPIPTYRSTLADVRNRLEGKVEPPPEPSLPLPIHAEEYEQKSSLRLGTKPFIALLVVVLAIIGVLYFRSSRPATPQDQPTSTASSETAPAGQPPADPSSPKKAPATSAPAPDLQSPRVPAATVPSSSASGSPGNGVQGAVLERSLPKVTAAAQSTIHGSVQLIVRVSVDPAGKVTDATLVRPGPSKYFARLALDSSRSWKFAPPEPQGQPVPSTWLLHYRFTAASLDAVATRETP